MTKLGDDGGAEQDDEHKGDDANEDREVTVDILFNVRPPVVGKYYDVLIYTTNGWEHSSKLLGQDWFCAVTLDV